MRFVEAPPPFDSVRLYPRGRDAGGDALLDAYAVNAFVPYPDGYMATNAMGVPIGPRLDPRAIYLVRDPEWGNAPGPGPLHRRVAGTLVHEGLHKTIENVENPKTSAMLDAPYGRYRAKHGGRSIGGV